MLGCGELPRPAIVYVYISCMYMYLCKTALILQKNGSHFKVLGARKMTTSIPRTNKYETKFQNLFARANWSKEFVHLCMYVCMRVFMYVCVYVCMFVCIYTHMYICMYVCVCVYVCTSVYVCMYICTHVRMYNMYVCMCVYVCTSVYVCMYICTHVRMYNMYVCMYVCMYVLCMYVYASTYFIFLLILTACHIT